MCRLYRHISPFPMGGVLAVLYVYSPIRNSLALAGPLEPLGNFRPHEAWCRYADPGPHPCGCQAPLEIKALRRIGWVWDGEMARDRVVAAPG
jgi:hypothetical protein